MNYIYEDEKEDLDYIIPFAAIGEEGMDISNINSKVWSVLISSPNLPTALC